MFRIFIFALAIAASAANVAAETVEEKRLSVLGIAKFMFELDKNFGCTNDNGVKIACKIDLNTDFKVFISPNKKHALVVVSYVPDPTGNVAYHSAMTSYESPETEGWAIDGYRYNIAGQEPHSIKFTSKKISFDMMIPKEGDARCCPTGKKTYTMPLAPI